MNVDGVNIFPLGTGALTVEFGREISVELNRKAISLAEYLDALAFDGYIESVPAYASTSIFFDVPTVRRTFGSHLTAFDAVVSVINRILPQLNEADDCDGRLIEIAVSFSTKDSPDLQRVADYASLTAADVVEIFTAVEYRVFMIGFLPGFAYMGKVDERIAAPRKVSPRTQVPAGSVGIAGRQTGIYPFESPGGWQIIGRTDVKLFDPCFTRPCFLRSGDMVRFVNADE
ncbi:MAG: 5-oxoprolinase subunit PxpB [Acidobacteriota bacterium]